MGAQVAKQREKSNDRKSTNVLRKLHKLRKNKTAPLFTTTSTVSLDKCESLIDIHGYQFKSPSYLDLCQSSNVEMDERPEDWIRAYKDLKNRVHASNNTTLERRKLNQDLEAFVLGLDECDVWELRSTLLEKAHRLGAILDEKNRNNENPGTQPATYVTPVSLEKQDLPKRVSSVQNTLKTNTPENKVFHDVSSRLDAIRFNMIEYYGDDKQEEFHKILDELQETRLDVRAIKDGGALDVIVTREEYEDYIDACQERFMRLVEINMRQAKTSIFSGGMARTARTRRSNSNVAAID